MTKRERKLVLNLQKSIKHTACDGTVYSYSPGFKKIHDGDTAEQVRTRLASGSEYSLGWQRCRQHVDLFLAELGFPPLPEDKP